MMVLLQLFFLRLLTGRSRVSGGAVSLNFV
jgi:hypothetical protein